MNKHSSLKMRHSETERILMKFITHVLRMSLYMDLKFTNGRIRRLVS